MNTMDPSVPARCLVDLESGDVLRAGAIERLPPKPLMLLRHFVQHRGAILTRDDLIAAVWGHLEAASDDAVNVAISSLRRALGDSERPFRIIETIPRRGYRYTGVDVELGAITGGVSPDRGGSRQDSVDPAAVREGPSAPSAPQSTWTQRWGILVGAAVLLLLGFWWLSPPPVASLPASAEPGAKAHAGTAMPSVAVLPFLDLSPASDHGYFADALVDRIIHMLAQAEGLQVAARTSSFAFRDSPAQVEEIGLKLRVGAVLEGSILRDGTQMRVLAQLIDVESGKHLWSRAYERAVDDMFAVQDDIAIEVSKTLTDTLLRAEVLRAPANFEAYELVVRARRAADLNSLAGARSAMDLLSQALAIDADYVPALVSLFEVGGLLHGLRGGSPKAEMDAAFSALQRARLLAPNDPEVLRAEGLELRRLGQLDEALRTYELALNRNPNDSVTQAQRGDLLMRLGRFDDALEALRMAERIDPLSDRIATRLADAYWSVGRAEEAMAKLRQNIRGSPGNPANYDRLATYLSQMGRTGEAMRYIIAQRDLDPSSAIRQFRVCEFYLQLADDAAAETCTDQFEQAQGPRFRVLYLRQLIHSFRGEWQAQNALMDELLLLAHSNDPLTPAVAAMSHARYRCDRALAILQERHAELFADPPQVSAVQTLAARVALHCLRQEGIRPFALRQAYAQTIERLRLQQGPWGVAGDEYAALLALSGEDDAAVAELGRLVDGGWRHYWWQLDQRLEYRQLAARADFMAIQQKLVDGVARERADFYAHRDMPL